MGNYKINKYPDGSSYVDISVFNKVITYRINSYEDLWHLKQITDAYQKSGLIPCITIPNLFDGQADRRFADNQSNGLKLVCEFLNTMYATFKIFHPHNPEVVEALVNDVEIIDNTNFITGVLFDLGKTYPDRLQDEYCKTNQGFYFDKRVADNTILMSSDAGGFKPLMKLCDKISWSGETFSASKSRTFEEGASKLTQKLNRKDFEGKDILIVDDISVYGGT
ncbi:MAG: phosphoribosyltransferase, partial [Candidatus Paceibacterota bacterium]